MPWRTTGLSDGPRGRGTSMGVGHHSSLPDPRGRTAKRGVGPLPGWVHQVASRGAVLFTGPWRQSNLKGSRAPCCPTGPQGGATLRGVGHNTMPWRSPCQVKDSGWPQRARPQRQESIEGSGPSPGGRVPLTQVSSPADPKVGQPRWEWGTTPVCKASEAGCMRGELASPPGHRGKVALRGLRNLRNQPAMPERWGSLEAWRQGAQEESNALHQPARLKRWSGLERSRLPPLSWRGPGLLARFQKQGSLEGSRAQC